MKKSIVTLIFILANIITNAQDLDLIVAVNGDSIACKIDSISETVVYYQVKSHYSRKWVRTMYDKENITLIAYDCINPSEYYFKKGSTIIAGSTKKSFPQKYPGKQFLLNASLDELNFYLARAKKEKKTGGIITLVGGGLILTGVGLISTNDEANGYAGLALGFLGSCITIVGLPGLIIGNSRVNSINNIKNSKGMAFEILPGGIYNLQTNQFQPGMTLKIMFL